MSPVVDVSLKTSRNLRPLWNMKKCVTRNENVQFDDGTDPHGCGSERAYSDNSAASFRSG